MTRRIVRIAAGVLVALGVPLLTAGSAWAQTWTVTFGPIEVAQQGGPDGGQMTVEFGPVEVIEDGNQTTYMEGQELVIEFTPPVELQGEELILFLPRQSITFDGGVDGGGSGGGGGGGGGVPPCPPDTGCGG